MTTYTVDIDAHPPLDRQKRREFDSALSSLGIREALGAPLTEGVSERECNARAISELEYGSLWGHPDCLDQLENAMLLTVDGGWLSHADAVLTLAETRGIPVVLQHETREQIHDVARAYPSLSLIVGGITSRTAMPEPIRQLMQEHPKLYLNLSGFIWSCNYVLHEWVQKLPVDRLLFGTAYPQGNPAGKLAGLRWELRDTDSSVIEKIFRETAHGLIQGRYHGNH